MNNINGNIYGHFYDEDEILIESLRDVDNFFYDKSNSDIVSFESKPWKIFKVEYKDFMKFYHLKQVKERILL